MTRPTAAAPFVVTPGVTLAKDVHHLIKDRPENSTIIAMLFAIYNTGKCIRLNVVLRTGVKIKIRITGFTVENSTNIKFTGEIAMNSEFVKVDGVLTGVTSGSFQLVD